MSIDRTTLITASGVLLGAACALASGLLFSDFTPLASSAPPTVDEGAPITFGNPAVRQQSIADRQSQLALMKPNSGSWDMLTLNETGRRKGRYLFTVFETGQAGIQRHDLKTGETDTIWQSLGTAGGHRSFDASYWTPWGTFITAEEAWTTAAAGSTSPYRPAVRAQEPANRARHP